MGKPDDLPVGDGLIRQSKDSVKNRRAVELKQALNLGFITEEEYEKAMKRLGK